MVCGLIWKRLFFENFLFIYSVSGLSCHTWDLSLRPTVSPVVVCWLSCSVAHGTLVSWPGIKPELEERLENTMIGRERLADTPERVDDWKFSVATFIYVLSLVVISPLGHDLFLFLVYRNVSCMQSWIIKLKKDISEPLIILFDLISYCLPLHHSATATLHPVARTHEVCAHLQAFALAFSSLWNVLLLLSAHLPVICPLLGAPLKGRLPLKVFP